MHSTVMNAGTFLYAVCLSKTWMSRWTACSSSLEMTSNNRGAADVVPTFQRVVERLEEWADENFTQLKDKVHVRRKT